MNRPREGTPRIVSALLTRVLEPEWREDVLGDLEERYRRLAQTRGVWRARWWYRGQAILLLLRPALWSRLWPRRDTSGTGALLADLRFAVRLGLHAPGASSAMVVTLAVGVTAATTVSGVFDRFFLRAPGSVSGPERIVEIYRLPTSRERSSSVGYDGFRVISPPMLERLLEESTTLVDGVLLSPMPMSVRFGAAPPERMDVSFVTPNYFDLLGTPVALGRDFDVATDGVADRSPVAVVSHALWRGRLQGDPSVLGRRFTLQGQEFTIVGVAPRGFVGTSIARRADLWAPVAMAGLVPVHGRSASTNSMYVGIARLRDGVTLQQAQLEARDISSRFAGDYILRLAPLREVTVDPNQRSVFLRTGVALVVVVVVVLFVASLNVTGILLGRAARRRREMAIRVSLGASPGRLFRQLFAESWLLFALGGITAVGAMTAGRPLIRAIEPPSRFFFSNPTLDLPLDGRVLTLALIATFLPAALFGLIPAIRASRTDPRQDLAGDAAGGTASFRVRDLLLSIQVALSVVALVGAGVFIGNLERARDVDLGFDPTGVGMVSVDVDFAGLDRPREQAFYAAVLRDVRAMPGVRYAGLSWLRPLEFGPSRLARASGDERESAIFDVRATAVSPGYFEALGITLLHGRGIGTADVDGTARAAVINERAARRAWPDASLSEVVGRRLDCSCVVGAETTVVGIVADSKQISVGEHGVPAVYVSMAQQRTVPTATLFFRTAEPVGHALPQVVRRIQAINPSVPVYDVEPAVELVRRGLWGIRAGAALLSGLGVIGLLLAAVGVYGSVASAVGEKKREMGIRIALGSGRPRVFRDVAGRALGLVAAGIGLGALGALGLSRTTSSMLFGVPAADPLILAVVAGTLVVAATAAAALPASRAMRLDPVRVLKTD